MTRTRLDPPREDLSSSRERLTDQFLNAYASSTRQAAEQSLKSLDTSTNWALTATLGIIAFVVNALVIKSPVNLETCELLLIILGVGFCMLAHFGVRAGKCYLNVIRFAKLEREALLLNLRLESQTADSVLDAIEKYHISWRSPLYPSVILRKVLFELGFLYLAIFMGIAYWFVSDLLPAAKSWICAVVLLVSAMVISIELTIFSRSPYIAKPAPNEDAESKA
jgi:hypothetical protein